MWPDLIAAIHASEYRGVLAVTGGGSCAIGQLLEVPGGSQTLLEAIVPYAPAALADFLGSAADRACTATTARAMAMASWMRARALSPETDPHQLFGTGVTASLVSKEPKRGEHRVHVATQTATATATYSVVLAKNRRDRRGEELIAGQLIFYGLAKACHIKLADTYSNLDNLLGPDEQLCAAEQQAEALWTDLLLGKRSYLSDHVSLPPKAVFPGAFNPPHAGHHRIAQIASHRLNSPVAYELSITNVDKPPLDFAEIHARLKQLRDCGQQLPILISDAPTFSAKAALFPHCTFVVGADTIVRIADPSYYGGNAAAMEASIDQIAARDCRFLVFGRDYQGKFCSLSNLELPSRLSKLCDEVTADEFRADVSSTALRAI